MNYARPIMWNVPEWAEITFYLLIPLVLLAFAAGAAWRIRKWFVGRAEPGAEKPRKQFLRQLLEGLRPHRLFQWVRTALFQTRLSPDGFALVMHLAIFWGMLVLAIGTALATVDQDFTNLLFDAQILRGDFYKLMKLGLDVFGVVLILGLAMAAYRRYLVRPERLQAARSGISLWDGFPFLSLLFAIAVMGFALEGLRLAEGFHIDGKLAAAQGAEAKARVMEEIRERFQHVGKERQDAQLARIAQGGPLFPAAKWSPVGYALGKVFSPLPVGSIRLAHQLVWWLHGLAAFGLIVAVPFTKAFHLISAPANMLLRTPAPRGRLPVAAESGVRTAARLHLATASPGRGLHLVRQVPGGLSRPCQRVAALAAEPGAGHRLAASAHALQGQRRDARAARHGCQARRALGLLHLPRLRGNLPRARPAAASDHRPPPAPGGPGPGGRRASGGLDELPTLRQLLRPVGAEAARLGKTARFQAQGRTQGRGRLPVVRRRLRFLRPAGPGGDANDRQGPAPSGRGRGIALREGAERGQRRAADRRGRTLLHAPREELQGVGRREIPQAAHHRPAHLQHAQERVPGRGAGSRKRGAGSGGLGGQARAALHGTARRVAPARRTEAEEPLGLHRHLPRSVLPGPVQRRVRAAPPRFAGPGRADWWKCRGTVPTASAAGPAEDGSG